MKPYERLDTAMDARRLKLGLSWNQLAGKAGITSEALRAIRRGKNRGRVLTRRKLDEALQWEPGSVDALFEGRIDPEEVREAEPARPDDDAPLTRGEFRSYVTLSQDPDAELPESALKKLRALGITLPRPKKAGGDQE